MPESFDDFMRRNMDTVAFRSGALRATLDLALRHLKAAQAGKTPPAHIIKHIESILDMAKEPAHV